MDVNKGYVTLTGRATFAKPGVEVTDTNGTLVTTVGLSTLTAGVMTIAVAKPDYPRTIMGFLTDANATITNGTVTLVGLDQNGNGITDTLTFTAAGAVNGVKAFSVLNSATWALVSGTVTATIDTMALGFGPALGCPAGPDAIFVDLLHASFDGGQETGTFSRTYGTYNPTGTMNAAKAVEVTFLYKVPIVQ